MRSYKTEGIVLKRTNFSETDKILTIFTKNHGKLHLIAKGIRKTTSRKAPVLEPFSLVRLFIANGRNLDIIMEADMVDNFREIRKDLTKIASACQCLELVDRLAPEKQVNRSLFELLRITLSKLNDDHSTTIITDFINQLLWDLGYLEIGKSIPENEATNFVEDIMEHRLKSDQLLTRIKSL